MHSEIVIAQRLIVETQMSVKHTKMIHLLPIWEEDDVQSKDLLSCRTKKRVLCAFYFFVAVQSVMKIGNLREMDDKFA